MTSSLLHSLVRSGRITPHDAALLIELRREVQLRRHWWYRAIRWLQGWVP